MIEDEIIDEAIKAELKKKLKKVAKGTAKAALAAACTGGAAAGTLYLDAKQAADRDAQQKKDTEYMNGGHTEKETQKMLNGDEKDRKDYNKTSDEFYKKMKTNEVKNFNRILNNSKKTILV